MRGNEPLPADRSPAQVLQFQIPMRGNEAGQLTQSHAEVAFQIPMRGNESRGPKKDVIVSCTFQIPMRGNERYGNLLQYFDIRLFQIPMRGNELLINRIIRLREASFKSP